MTDFDRFVEQVLTAVTDDSAGQGVDRASRPGSDQVSGLREGLTTSGPVRLGPSRGESTKYHAGYLSGLLLSWLASRRSVDENIILTASAYASALATPEGQRALPGHAEPTSTSATPPSALKAHVFAAALTEKHRAGAIDAALERAFFGWLLDQTGTPATRQLVAKMERLRERRLQRTGR